MDWHIHLYFVDYLEDMQISQFPRSVGLVVRQICITGVPMKGKPQRNKLYQPTQGIPPRLLDYYQLKVGFELVIGFNYKLQWWITI